MISVHVEMDLDQHISVVSAKLIELMAQDQEQVLEGLMRKFLKLYEEYTPEQFMDALSFLFTMGNLSLDGYKVRLINV